MRKITKALVVALCVLLFSGCQSNNGMTSNTESAHSATYTSVDQMKSVVDGAWMNGSTGEYVIISDGTLLMINNTNIRATLDKLKYSYNPSFDEFFRTLVQDFGKEIDYDYENGYVIFSGTGRLFFRLSGDKHAFNESSTMFMKNTAYLATIEENLFDAYIESIYPDLLTSRDVQYDKYGTRGKNFMITGTAELDDYYNWGYDNYESSHFCIRIRPTGGSYSDEWYIYASRNDFRELFDALKNGSQKLRIIAQTKYVDTGLNNMAILVDYFD